MPIIIELSRAQEAIPRRITLPRFPTNRSIIASLDQVFLPLARGMSHTSAQRYGFGMADVEDMVGHVRFKLARVDWRAKLHSNLPYIRTNFGVLPAYPLPIVNKALYGYAHSLVRHAVFDEVRRIRSAGMTGLQDHRTHKIATMPWTEGLPEPTEAAAMEPANTDEGAESRAAGKEIAQLAELLCTQQEFLLLQLQFGFDGGGVRSLEQVAKASGLSRAKVEQLVEKAMQKVRRRIYGNRNGSTTR